MTGDSHSYTSQHPAAQPVLKQQLLRSLSVPHSPSASQCSPTLAWLQLRISVFVGLLSEVRRSGEHARARTARRQQPPHAMVPGMQIKGRDGGGGEGYGGGPEGGARPGRVFSGATAIGGTRGVGA